MRNSLKSALVAGGIAASVFAAGTPAIAADAPTPNVITNVNTTCNTTTQKVAVALYAANHEARAVSAKFTTPYGTVTESVPAGTAVYKLVDSGKGNVAAGTVAVSTYLPATTTTAAEYKYTTQAFPAKVCTQPPKGYAHANDFYVNGTVTISGYYRNNDIDPATVRFITPYGQSDAITVQPGKAAYFTVNTHRQHIDGGTADIRAYKYIDGKGFETDNRVTFNANGRSPQATLLRMLFWHLF